jgi:hypothetical protein
VIAVEYHSDLKEVQCDAALSALLGDGAQDAPFDRLAWWQGLEAHCGLSPLLGVARNSAGIAVLPLATGGGHIMALSNYYTFRYRPLVSAGGDGPALLSALARDLHAHGSRISLPGVPAEDGSAALLEQAFHSAGWTVFSEACDENHILCLNDRSYAEYLASRPGQLRTTLNRKTAKVDAQVVCRFDPEVWAHYEAIYAQSWKPSEGSPAFLRAFAQAEGAAGRLRLGVAYAGGRAIAAQLWTVEGSTAFIHKLAHIEEAKPLSPGTVLSACLFRHTIDEDKVSLIDFGTGNDPYKRDWMEEQRLRYRLEMFRAADPANWLPIIRRTVSRLARSCKHG